MLLELYGFEESIRQRQTCVSHDVEMYRMKVAAGPVRRTVGSMLVRFGEYVRGAASLPQVARQG
jgi:hypothetical protein